MRFLVIMLVITANASVSVLKKRGSVDFVILWVVFKNEKVILGKSECLCSFKMQDRGANCSGKAKCDKTCSGTGKVEI